METRILEARPASRGRGGSAVKAMASIMPGPKSRKIGPAEADFIMRYGRAVGRAHHFGDTAELDKYRKAIRTAYEADNAKAALDLVEKRVHERRAARADTPEARQRRRTIMRHKTAIRVHELTGKMPAA
jgi:hypothetical protein